MLSVIYDPLSVGQGVVETMYLEEGELITAGADGFVKVPHAHIPHTATL